jgi:hypothetical protein
MPIFDYDDTDVDMELVYEAREQRRRARRMWHWCDECHGHTGPGSPCYVEPEESRDDEEESDVL